MFLETGNQANGPADGPAGGQAKPNSEKCDWTIVIPFFNEAGFLPATLRSVAALQGAFRLVLVDNGSTDGSSEIARQVCGELGLGFTLVVEPCPGKVHALRAGLARVRTRFVATFDADTHYPPHYLVAAGKLLDRPGVAIAGAYFTNGPAWQRRDAFTGAHVVAAGRMLGHQCHAGGAGQAFNTALLRRAGGFDPNRWNLVLEDHEIIHRVGQFGAMAYGMDFWCHPSPRERDRESIRWTLYERLAYHFTPRSRQGRFFYDFLGRRLRARKLSSERMRERAFQQIGAAEQGAGSPGRLVVCADDFGLTSEISRSIVALAGQGKLNAITCMAVCPGWETDAPLLRILPRSVQIGLHVTLTDEVPLTAMPVLAWDGHIAAEQRARAARPGPAPAAGRDQGRGLGAVRSLRRCVRPPAGLRRCAPACPCAARHSRDHPGRDGAPGTGRLGAQLRRHAHGHPRALLPVQGDGQCRAVARRAARRGGAWPRLQ